MKNEIFIKLIVTSQHATCYPLINNCIYLFICKELLTNCCYSVAPLASISFRYLRAKLNCFVFFIIRAKKHRQIQTQANTVFYCFCLVYILKRIALFLFLCLVNAHTLTS